MPKVAISADFLTAYSRIPRAQQKKVRQFITRFQIDPTAASINYEPIHNTRDKRVRTVRIDLAYRAIVLHPDKGDVYLLAWVDHHDEAMDWAKRKIFEVNPVTGSLQVFDIESMGILNGVKEEASEPKSIDSYKVFETFSDEELLRTGLPAPLLPAIRAIDGPEFLDQMQPHLPEEAYETLFWIANLGYSVDQALTEVSTKLEIQSVDANDLEDALDHPDSRRRFTVIETADELIEMLNAPLEKWRVFLHPAQASLVKASFDGPARVLGGAGTGKTVVAMHRARYLATQVFTAETDRVLFTTYTKNLARNIQDNLKNLCGSELERIEVVHLHSWAARYLQSKGVKFAIATEEEVGSCWQDAFSAIGTHGWDEGFIRNEWAQVVQALGITSSKEYLRATRGGRRVQLARPERAKMWEIFDEYKRNLNHLAKVEWIDLIRETRLNLQTMGASLPYKAVIVDETQDMHPEELKLIRQLVPEGHNDLFLVGDAHQRIYGQPVNLSSCGIDVRKRAKKLRINYRTTEEIRDWSVKVLIDQPIDDLDGGIDEHLGYRSLLHGPKPDVKILDSLRAELEELKSVIGILEENNELSTICLVARTSRQLEEQYLPALQNAHVEYHHLKANTPEDDGDGIRVATMHRIKGLEFHHMIIVGVNDGVLPFEHKNLDKAHLLEYEIKERCLLHVAASRARDSLFIFSYGEPSRFLRQIGGRNIMPT